MNLFELQTIYKRLYRVLQKERLMRNRVFYQGHKDRESKLAEIDQALADITTIKDELKRHLAQPEQSALFDVPPARREYA